MDVVQHTADRGRMMALALLGNVVPVAIATGFTSHRPPFYIGAIVVCLVPLLVTGLPDRLSAIRRIVSFAGLPALTAMQAYSGGAASGYAVLMMMAMVWFGLQAADRDVLVMIALLAVCAYGPILVFGAPAYPPHWNNATLLVLVGVTVAGSMRMAMREVRRLTARLQAEAILDPLTGLLNRRGWERAVAPVLARAERTSDSIILLAFDLDRFKELNDTYGHETGDNVLCETASRMRSSLRAGDIVARIGGDEFLALLTDSTVRDALVAVERMRAPSTVSFSAGLVARERCEPLADLARRADLALYAAKAAGGARTEVAGPSLEAVFADC